MRTTQSGENTEKAIGSSHWRPWRQRGWM